ncbi:MAG: hypothetical protein KC561_16750, partial [Myxococcales bacterium]|nr:hypothetical protein [Myxococcales bacterium]
EAPNAPAHDAPGHEAPAHDEQGHEHAPGTPDHGHEQGEAPNHIIPPEMGDRLMHGNDHEAAAPAEQSAEVEAVLDAIENPEVPAAEGEAHEAAAEDEAPAADGAQEQETPAEEPHAQEAEAVAPEEPLEGTGNE